MSVVIVGFYCIHQFNTPELHVQIHQQLHPQGSCLVFTCEWGFNKHKKLPLCPEFIFDKYIKYVWKCNKVEYGTVSNLISFQTICFWHMFCLLNLLLNYEFNFELKIISLNFFYSIVLPFHLLQCFVLKQVIEPLMNLPPNQNKDDFDSDF